MSKNTNDLRKKTVAKSNSSKKKKRKKPKPLAARILLGFVAIILLIVGGGYVYLNYIVGNFNGIKLNKDKLGITSDAELSKYANYTDIVNIALFGVDSTDASATGRSDATMVATLDPIHKKIKITSFMRDSYVNITDYGMDKLTHAYAFGGPELAINTLNQNFGLNIEKFAAVDFSTLPVIIDSLGGLELEITAEETEYINFYINELNDINGTTSANIYNAGVQHVDGTQALAYSRIRYTAGGDYERTHRQRIVLNALFEKALDLPATQYLSTINKIFPYVQTNLTTNDVLALATKVCTLGLSGVSLEQERFPLDNYSEGTNIDGIYYLAFDAEATKEQVKEYIFNDVSPSEEVPYTETYEESYDYYDDTSY